MKRTLFLFGVLIAIVGLLWLKGEEPARAETPPIEPEASPPVEATPPVEAAPARSLPAGYLHFARACEAGDTVTIGAVGDLLIHRELQRQAWKEPEHFEGIWRGVSDLIAQADISYANLEGPVAPGINAQGVEVEDPGREFDNVVYTGYPRFNFHPQILQDLVRTGFDVVSTANNHALDRQSLGADKTVRHLDRAKLPFTGTRRKGESEKRRPWYVITEAKGIRVAWLACTKNVNRFEDTHKQVLFCYDDEKKIRDEVRALSRRKNVDAVIVTPHWGREYKHEPSGRQRKWAQKILDSGAIAVIGNHPHVIQPWETYQTKDGREGFIIYSIGNFASHQPELPKRSTVLLYLGLTRGPEGDVWLNGARYVPMHTRHDVAKDAYYTEAIDRVGGWEDARDLLIALMGPWNLMPPDAPLVTNPHCDPAWTFPEGGAP